MPQWPIGKQWNSIDTYNIRNNSIGTHSTTCAATWLSIPIISRLAC